MHDPRQSADSSDFSSLAGHGGEKEQALDVVGAVETWYGAQIARERRAPVPDAERLEELQAARQEAIDAQRRLEEADPDETARIAALYAARLKELKNS
ncbi:hypothetical protein ACWGCW_12725 [Streptomyces sp. NPDC054933]